MSILSLKDKFKKDSKNDNAGTLKETKEKDATADCPFC